METGWKTVLETLQAGAAWLEKRGVPEPRRNMEYLLAHVLGMKRLQLYLQFDRPLKEEELEPLRALLKRRGTREPLQHILGTVDFAGIELAVDRRALIPRPETEELVMRLLKRGGPAAGGRVLDVGCGSGALGLALAHAWLPAGVRVDLVDRSEEALELARGNARALGLAEHPGLRIFASDLFSALDGAAYDLIVANLPYIPSGEIPELEAELGYDPVMALDGGADGLDLLRRFADECSRYLAPGGMVALEVGAGQGAAVADLLSARGLAGAAVLLDTGGVDRFVEARMPD